MQALDPAQPPREIEAAKLETVGESLRPWAMSVKAPEQNESGHPSVNAWQDVRAGRWMRLFVVISAATHAAAMSSVLLLRHAAPAALVRLVDVTLMEVPPPPPPPVEPEQAPPPPSPPPVRAPKLPEPVVTPKPVEVPQPYVPPVMVANGESASEAKDEVVVQEPPKVVEDKGVVGGVPGGVPGGIVGGRLPPPPPPPNRPVRIDVEFARKKRVAGKDPPYPRRAEANGTEGLVVVKVVIDPAGRVSQTMFLQGHPAFDDAVRSAIAGWRFTPHVVNGVAVPVYTVFRFTFKLA